MNKLYHSLYGRLGAALLLLITAFIVHSCRKSSVVDDPAMPDVNAAKSWYEKTYPTAQNLKLMDMATAGQTTNGDFSQIIKPDWGSATSYTKFNTNIIELPLDSAVRLGFAHNGPSTAPSYDKSLSKSVFLIFGSPGSYKAYVVTLIADSAYVGNDYSRVSNLSYQNKPASFSGSILYFTPNGTFINGWRYKDG